MPVIDLPPLFQAAQRLYFHGLKFHIGLTHWIAQLSFLTVPEREHHETLNMCSPTYQYYSLLDLDFGEFVMQEILNNLRQ